MKKNQKKSFSFNKMLNKIKGGKIKMRPKIYFVLKAVLLILGFAVAALFVLYLISFIIFALRASGVWHLSRFGFRGIGAAIVFLPWLLIVIALVLIAGLQIFARKLTFSWRQPVIYSLTAMIIFLLLGGALIDKSQLHSGLFQKAKQGRLPVAGRLYRGFGMKKPGNVHQGIVLELTDDTLLIETSNDEVLTIMITSKTRFPSGKSVKKDDVVIVLGKKDGSSVRAFGIRKISDNLNRWPRRKLPKDFPKKIMK